MSPGSGAIVMGTGIVSVALHLEGAETISRLLLAITVLAWLILSARAFLHRHELRRAIGEPAALTAVAGTAVLGTRFAQLGWTGPAIALLVVGGAACPPLLGPAVRSLQARVTGDAYLLVVAPESIAVLACVIADLERLRWLTLVALALASGGICLYPAVLARFELSNVRDGYGEQWVAGGSLAISTLALAEIARTSRRLGLISGGELADAALAVWIAAIAWLPALVLYELRRPRLRYDLRRWSMVFPLGMYAVCSFTLASVRSPHGIADFAWVWTWVALAGWLAVSAAGLARASQGRRSPPAPRLRAWRRGKPARAR
jgi:tellurite resistance protein TehA-like permease